MARKTGKNKKGAGQDDYRKKMREDATKRQTSTFGVIDKPKDALFVEPSKGKNYWDIIPYRVSIPNHPTASKDTLWPRKVYGVHRDIGPENKSFVCPKETLGKKCPVCEEYTKQKGLLDWKDPIVKALKPKLRELYNVVILDSKKHKEIIQIFDTSYHNFGSMLDEDVKNSEEGSIEETWGMLKGGASLTIKFREDSFGGRTFLKASNFEFEERDDYDEEWADDAYDLDKLVVVLSYNELYEAFWDTEAADDSEETEEEEDSDDEEEDSSNCKKSRSSKRSRKQTHDEDEEEDSSDEEEDEDTNTDDEDEEQEEEEDEGEASTPEELYAGDPECGHEGGVYGESTDEFEECEDCDEWVACGEAKEVAKKSKKKSSKSKKKSASKKSKSKETEEKTSGRRRRRN